MIFLVLGLLTSIVHAVEMDINPYTACLVTNENVLKCWGNNEWGVIPEMYPETVQAPRVMTAFSEVKSVAVTDNRGCAVAMNGELKCWGTHYDYEREGYTVYKTSSPATYVSMSDDHVCATTQNGDVECMVKGSKTFTKITGIKDADSITVSQNRICVRDKTSDVWCWGVLHKDQTGATAETGVPTKIKNLPKIVFLAKGEAQCGLSSEGKVVCWSGPNGKPTTIATSISAKHFDQKGSTGCAALADNTVECWNGIGSPPSKTVGLVNIDKVFVGDKTICAEQADKVIKCWGKGFSYLGNAGKTNTTPFELKSEPAVPSKRP